MPLIAAGCITLISLIGLAIFRKSDFDTKRSYVFLSLSVGTFLGVTFFELLPEAFHETEYASIALGVGFLGFLLLSRLIHEYHHHHYTDTDAHARGRGALILWGDAVHNVADGIVIATAFAISPALGWATTVGIALHEIPQEIAEFYILLRAGYTRSQAALYNLFSASSVIVGTAATLFFMERFSEWNGILIGVAAGNLLYIAASDLLPELRGDHHEGGNQSFTKKFILVCLSLIAIAFFLTLMHEHEEDMPHDSLATTQPEVR